MATYFSSDITFLALQNLVLQELKEPVNTGSEAVPLDLVKDKINEVYSDAFNDQRMKQSARENNISFRVASDTYLTADVAIGATSITVSDCSTFLSAGKLLLQSEIVTYTGTNGVDTFTGVSGVNVNHASGEACRQVYPLSTIASDLDTESVQYLDINGLPQTFMEYPSLITATTYYPNSYTIYKRNLIFSRQGTVGSSTAPLNALMMYTQQVTALSADADKPTLIPNSYRIPLLVYGACTRIAASDAYRTSWDWWQKEYDRALSQYIAFRNTRVKDVNNKRRPTVYNSFSSLR